MHQLLLQCVATCLLCCGVLQCLTQRGLYTVNPLLQLLQLATCFLHLGAHTLALFPGTIDFTMRTILNPAQVDLLCDALLLGLESQFLQLQLQGLAVLPRITALPHQVVALLLQSLNLSRAFFQEQLQVR